MKTFLEYFTLAVLLFPTWCFGENSLADKEKPFNEHMFIENKGQLSDENGQQRKDVLFYGQIKSADFYLTQNGISYQQYQVVEELNARHENLPNWEYYKRPGQISIERIDIVWQNANKPDDVEKHGKSSDYENFYYNYCADGIERVYAYEKLVYKNIYDNIDLIWHSNSSGIKYDFYVKNPLDYNQIKLRITGAKELEINAKGQLEIKGENGIIVEDKPVVFQGERKLEASFVIEGNVLSFKIEGIDGNEPLLIDPLVREWGTYYGSGKYDRCNGTTLDSDGNVYIVGETFSRSKISSVNAHQLFIAGMADMFITKFDSSGNRLWSSYYGGKKADYGWRCSTDPNNNVYLCGYTYSDTLLATANAHQTALKGDSDGLLVKMDKNGKRLWATYLGGENTDFAWDCKTVGNYGIVLSGTTYSKNEISTNSSYQSSLAGSSDAFIARFTNKGKLEWATYYGGTSIEMLRALSIDNSGKIYIGGSTRSNNGISTSNALNTKYSGNDDGFIAIFDSTGGRTWASYFGGSNNDIISDCALDSAHNLYITGYTNSTSGIANSKGFMPNYAKLFDAFLIKVDANGKEKWATYYGDSSFDVSNFCTVDPYGSIYMGGYTKSEENVSTTGTFYNKNRGLNDAFLVKFNRYGDRVWATYYGGTEEDKGYGCVVDKNLGIYLSGYTESTSRIAKNGLKNSYDQDGEAFLVKFNDTCSQKVYLNVSECYEYTTPSGKNTYYTSGTYFDTIASKNGCDSVIIIDLKIRNVLINISETACKSYKSPTGKVYLKSGVYYDTLLTTKGCDSVIVTNLKLGVGEDTTVNANVCSKYPAPSGKAIWRKSGVYFDTISTVKGCDSIIQVNLTVGNHAITRTKILTCDSLVSPSRRYVYNQSGQYFDTIVISQYCDSIIIIDLTIVNSKSALVQKTICDSMVSPSGFHIWDTTGEYIDTIGTKFKCDSIIKFLLDVNYSSSVFDTVSACESYISPYTLREYNRSGIYREKILNTQSCDSNITIRLTINTDVTDTLYAKNCKPMVSPSGKYEYSQTGLYFDTLSTQFGCDSIIQVFFTYDPIDTSISKTENFITANGNETRFQWLDCENNYMPIPNEVGKVFAPNKTGAYAVEIKKKTCTDTSRCVNLTIINDNNISENVFSVYPNPTTDYLIIESEEVLTNVSIRITDMAGRLLIKESISENSYKLLMPLNLPSGTYQLHLSNENSPPFTTLIKKL
jgi:hypothetical protein